MDEEREEQLPASAEAERCILGAILLDERYFPHVEEYLRAEDFHLDAHRRIYSAIRALIEGQRVPDLITVAERLRVRKEVEAVGGVAYLASLTEGVPRRLNIVEYVRIVKQKAGLRRVIKLAADAQRRAYDQSESTEALLADVQEKLETEVQDATPSEMVSIGQYIETTYPTPESFADHHRRVPGIPWGWAALDGLTSGMRPGELIIIAARPGMGKSAMAFNLCTYLTIRWKKKVALFSLEMPKRDVLDRLVCAHGLVSLAKHRAGCFSAVERRYVQEAMTDFSEALLYIDDSPAQTVPQMLAKAMKLGDVDLVVVDYLQLIQGSGGDKKNREQEVAAISRSLKAMARRLEIPLVVLAQLSRASEQRTSKRPLLSDLRESGSIEQDADMVLFIHRDEYYGRDDDNEGVAEFIVAKQRQGALGTAQVHYASAVLRFTDVECP